MYDDYEFVMPKKKLFRFLRWFRVDIGTEVEVTSTQDETVSVLCCELTPEEVDVCRDYLENL